MTHARSGISPRASQLNMGRSQQSNASLTPTYNIANTYKFVYETEIYLIVFKGTRQHNVMKLKL